MFYLIGSFKLTLQEERCRLNDRGKLSKSDDNEVLEFLSLEVFKNIRRTSATNDNRYRCSCLGQGDKPLVWWDLGA